MSDIAKRNAALKALELVQDGMVLGLGTGSTAAHFVTELGKMVADGLDVMGAPTSLATEQLARDVGIPLVELENGPHIDLTIDGADEFDPALRLIKGGGAALLREKIIADASERMVVITDASKQVEKLGAFPLPLEVNPFGMELTRKRILDILAMLDMDKKKVELRTNSDGVPLITDGGHHIFDLHCKVIEDPDTLGACLDQIPGIVEHGLFLDMADAVIIGDDNGARVIER